MHYNYSYKKITRIGGTKNQALQRLSHVCHPARSTFATNIRCTVCLRFGSQSKDDESAVSHQLRVLRAMRLVKYRKEGRNVYYSLADHHVINLYRDVAAHLEEPGH